MFKSKGAAAPMKKKKMARSRDKSSFEDFEEKKEVMSNSMFDEDADLLSAAPQALSVAADFDEAEEEDEASSDASDEELDAGGMLGDEGAAPELSLPPGSASELINLQQFNGSFKLDAAFAKVVGAALGALRAALSADKIAPLSGDEAWATLLALAAFEKHHQAASDMWSMVAEKAKTWLLAQFKAAGVERKEARVKLDQMVQVAKQAL